jgi:hypothetical protein
MTPPPGVTEDRLTEFETCFGVALPADMREYFLHVDGMGEHFKWDDDLFNFRSLNDLELVNTPASNVADVASYFVFADHSIWLPAYAIRLTGAAAGPHPVIAIETDGMISSAPIVAQSFSEFVVATWPIRSREFASA